MVDNYSGYKASFNAKKTEEPCIELGCWTVMHAGNFLT